MRRAFRRRRNAWSRTESSRSASRMCRPRSSSRARRGSIESLRPVRLDLLAKVVVLLAWHQADLAQLREVLLGLREVAGHEVGLAHVLVRAAVARAEHEGALVVAECVGEVAGIAVCEAEVVLDVGVAGVAQR